ncbi:hypothetical protein AB6A40_005689 [Gnathostoma spinigerum]|uniref:Uncharacterized protein n=1 Tax=Gnathostoma spinigerum TaxID=75299 RepID=A0ABD6EG59_9BILA
MCGDSGFSGCFRIERIEKFSITNDGCDPEEEHKSAEPPRDAHPSPSSSAIPQRQDEPTCVDRIYEAEAHREVPCSSVSLGFQRRRLS